MEDGVPEREWSVDEAAYDEVAADGERMLSLREGWVEEMEVAMVATKLARGPSIRDGRFAAWKGAGQQSRRSEMCDG